MNIAIQVVLWTATIFQISVGGPQCIKIIRSKLTKGVPFLAFAIIFNAGAFCTLTSIAQIIAVGVDAAWYYFLGKFLCYGAALFFSTIIIVMKLKLEKLKFFKQKSLVIAFTVFCVFAPLYLILQIYGIQMNDKVVSDAAVWIVSLVTGILCCIDTIPIFLKTIYDKEHVIHISIMTYCLNLIAYALWTTWTILMIVNGSGNDFSYYVLIASNSIETIMTIICVVGIKIATNKYYLNHPRT